MTITTVGIHEAKTHFSKLIKDIKKGNQITITQRGLPVAVLSPYIETDQTDKNRQAAIKGIRKFRAQQTSIKIEEFEQILKADQK